MVFVISVSMTSSAGVMLCILYIVYIRKCVKPSWSMLKYNTTFARGCNTYLQNMLHGGHSGKLDLANICSDRMRGWMTGQYHSCHACSHNAL